MFNISFHLLIRLLPKRDIARNCNSRGRDLNILSLLKCAELIFFDRASIAPSIMEIRSRQRDSLRETV